MKIIKKIVDFFRFIRKYDQKRIEYLVLLSIFARDNFNLKFNVNDKEEVKKIEKLFNSVYIRPDGTQRSRKESRKIARELKKNALRSINGKQ